MPNIPDATRLLRETAVPFNGFYETWDHDTVTSLIEDYFMNEETGEPEPPENFYNTFDYTPCFEAYAKAYTTEFANLLNEELGTHIKLVFDSMDSPKYYNYETDQIYAYIRLKDIKELWKHTTREALENQIKARHTSCSGFISFYSNDILEWVKKPLNTWDQNEICTLLYAAIDTIPREDDWFTPALIGSLREQGSLQREIETLVYQWAENQEKQKETA